MVNKCAAIHCRSGYAREKKDSNITFHSFRFNDEKEKKINAREFFNAINCEGLWKLTPEIFNVKCLCWTIFAELCQEQMRQTFLNGLNQREVVNEIVSMAFYERRLFSPGSC